MKHAMCLVWHGLIENLMCFLMCYCIVFLNVTQSEIDKIILQEKIHYSQIQIH